MIPNKRKTSIHNLKEKAFMNFIVCAPFPKSFLAAIRTAVRIATSYFTFTLTDDKKDVKLLFKHKDTP